MRELLKEAEDSQHSVAADLEGKIASYEDTLQNNSTGKNL